MASRLAQTGGILPLGETYAPVKNEIATQAQGLIALKGILRPIQAFKVVGIYDDLTEFAHIIRINQPGLRLLVNPDELSAENKAGATAAPEQAAAHRKQQTD